jgi:hypothetical protein
MPSHAPGVHTWNSEETKLRGDLVLVLDTRTRRKNGPIGGPACRRQNKKRFFYSWGIAVNRCPTRGWGMPSRLVGFLCLVLAFSCGSCDCRRKEGPTGSTPKKGVAAKRPFFRIGDSQLAVLKTNSTKLRLGCSRTEAITIMGRPDNVSERWTKDSPPSFKGWWLEYDVQIWEQDLVNVGGDQRIILAFNEDDQLEAVLSTVPGVSSRGDER